MTKNELDAIDLAIKALEQEPSSDMVSRGVFEQVMWERDVAIEQLKELGYELGEKIRTTTAGEGDTYKYLLHGAESLVKDHPDLVRDIWNCSSCEHTEDECKDCYPELGYKNNKLRRDTEAVKEFVKSDTFKELMESLDKQDRAATEDAEQFLRDIKAKEQEE